MDHHNDLKNVKPLQRGQQFDFYSSGRMTALGTRAPAGGRPGDAYAMYHGMEAETLKGMTALFNHAEVQIYLILDLNTDLLVYVCLGCNSSDGNSPSHSPRAC